MSLVFKKIENRDIFTRDFSPLVRNNEISFPTSEEIAVVYGPNGTGKTSLIKVLENAKDTKVEFSLDGTDFQTGNEVFHIINDQNNRNIISGETRDFFLGDNIRHEFELQDQVAADRNTVISAILSLIKNTFAISAGNNPLIELLPKVELATFIKDCANSKSKGNRYTTDALVALLSSLEHHDIPEYLYIQEIISNSMNKPLTIERDENRRLRIYLSSQEFLGKTRDELPLSTGEQNFLSLTFEFLKAKNSTCPIVVIDDPVSSFDSIYKNKVVYAIVKMLHHKKRIVLTHNTDLIRLLDGQYKHCFKLYLLNNTDGELNGFIPLKNNEQEMLISLEKLLTAFRESVPRHVVNPELFLISMIPFMRGYANIICNRPLFESLTQVMHGYKTEKVDVARAYSELFGEHPGHLPDSYEVSVTDILGKTVDGVRLLETKKFPLLDRTLRHSFVYLFLRLIVEKNLVEKFGIDTTHNEQLGQIISAAYPDENDVEQIRNRIRLTSKKTLINEFNHFEGNLSIFQPAIDITDQALGKERTDLITFISTL